MIRGLDVSKWQPPNMLEWGTLSKSHSFVYARATYGTRPDKSFAEHVLNAQEHDVAPGGYHFFRQTQPASDQWDAFLYTLQQSRCGSGWLPPCIDVEENAKYDGPLDPGKYAAGVREMADRCRERFGAVTIYVTQRDWRRLGNPDWISDPDVYLWVAHWGVPKPATPMDLLYDFWQHTVGKVEGYSHDIDQNVCALDELPLLGCGVPDTERPPPPDNTLALSALAKARAALDEAEAALRGQV